MMAPKTDNRLRARTIVIVVPVAVGIMVLAGLTSSSWLLVDAIAVAAGVTALVILIRMEHVRSDGNRPARRGSG